METPGQVTSTGTPAFRILHSRGAPRRRCLRGFGRARPAASRKRRAGEGTGIELVTRAVKPAGPVRHSGVRPDDNLMARS